MNFFVKAMMRRNERGKHLRSFFVLSMSKNVLCAQKQSLKFVINEQKNILTTKNVDNINRIL